VGRENIILAARAFLTASLTERCTVERPAALTTNTTTGAVTTTWSTLYTVQPCKVGTSTPSGQDVGEAHVVTLSPLITVPVEVVGLVEEDRITITASELDPELVGRVYRVLGPTHRTFVNRRQLSVIEVTS
jgi:hypothetical protein